MSETILKTNNACSILDELVKTHALTPQQRAKVDIFSQLRGGIGSRGYGKNSLGYEIAWWVHPQRYQQEMQFLLSHLAPSGKQNILSLGCGPAFHEIALARTFPNLNILATDLDEREIATAKSIASDFQAGDNLALAVGDALSILGTHQDSQCDHIISLATLHDLPQLELVLESIARCLVPNGLFIFSYNPHRLQKQFDQLDSLEKLLDRHFEVIDSLVLTDEGDSLAYYGDITRISRQKRGYPLAWYGMVVRRK